MRPAVNAVLGAVSSAVDSLAHCGAEIAHTVLNTTVPSQAEERARSLADIDGIRWRQVDPPAAGGCPSLESCPDACDRTDQGCAQVWGPDADHLEAMRRNGSSEGPPLGRRRNQKAEK